MTLRERQRLQRVAELSAQAYKDARRNAALHIMRGTANEQTLSQLRWTLTNTAQAVAEAVATLSDHADDAA